MNQKLNVLLGKTDALAPIFKGHLKDYIGFYKNSQGAFLGEKKTYSPREGTIDLPANRNNKLVQTTVDEKLRYFVEHQSEYINAVLDQEATNASGAVKAELIVDGQSWGEMSSLELLRLRGVLDMQEFKDMHSTIPVRSDAEVWNKTTNEDYSDRNIWESPLIKRVEKTTDKESYILADPNIQFLKDNNAYKPQIGVKTITVELGDATAQKFSGEWTQKQKADVLAKISKLKVAITEALKKCNEAEVVKSAVDSNKVFGYLYGSL
jgi:hypothetical protein